MSEPDVSVVIPTYNRRLHLPEAVESCFEGNEQLDIEVIVVDDGSTDGTHSWGNALTGERVVYVRQDNQGAPVARNRGMKEAHGRYLKFLDDDDQLTEGRLVEEVRVLEETGAAVCCGDLFVQRPYADDIVFETDPSPDLAAGIFTGQVVTYPHVFLYRRKSVEDVDWDPTLQYHQDTDFAVRVAGKGLSAISLDQIVGRWNDHEGARISTKVKSKTDHAEIVRQRIATLKMGLKRLREGGNLREHHREAAAQRIWQWAHITAAYDLQCFQECVESIREIAPDFSPSRSSLALSLMDRLVGAPATEKTLFPLRWLKQRFGV